MSWCLSFIHSVLIELFLFPLKTLSNGWWAVTIMVSLNAPTRYKQNLNAKSTAMASKSN